MILNPDQAANVATLISTPDDLLPLFSPLERAVILALKRMAKNQATGI
ncbi:Uncharacterised protein [uncultured archaeon]|nr:Uncharacterised protein [uncultured archaeon]